MLKKPIRTKHYKNLLEDNQARELYLYLKDNILWEEGVRSKQGFTRLAHSLHFDSIHVDALLPAIVISLEMCEIDPIRLKAIYLNYYKDGSYWTPNHNHPNTIQIILSLGAERILEIGSKSYNLNSGDLIYFGSSIHGVPKDYKVKKGRISIAMFVEK